MLEEAKRRLRRLDVADDPPLLSGLRRRRTRQRQRHECGYEFDPGNLL